MLRTLMKSKLHRATVTAANLNYEGSITLDEELMEAADLLPFERVQVINLANGERFETYVIPGPRGSGVLCLNGGAARLAVPGDPVLVISYVQLTEEEALHFQPKTLFLDERNQLRETRVQAVQGA